MFLSDKHERVGYLLDVTVTLPNTVGVWTEKERLAPLVCWT